MADIKVVIQLQDTVEDIIEQLGGSTEVNNASIQKTNGSFGSLSTKNNGTNMKSWANVIKDREGNVVSKVVNGETITDGLLSLADGYVGGENTQLIEQYGYNGYVFGAVPESKQLTVTLEVRGQNIDSIIIYGDKKANQFPTKAYRDNDTNDIIYSDDPIWAIKFDDVSSSHTITFLEWNRANYNACITYVAELKNKLYLDKSWIKSVESLSQSTGQPKEIYYGVTPSTGNIEILDIDGEIKDYIRDGIVLSSGLKLKLYTQEQYTQTYITNDSNYNYYDRTLSIPLSDILEKILDTTYSNSNLLLNTNAFILLKDVLNKMGYGDNDIEYMVGEDIVVSTYTNGVQTNKIKTVKEYLSNINIPYGYFENTTFRDTLNKFCTLAQLNLTYKDCFNLPVFVSARPIINGTQNILYIPKGKQFKTPNEELFVKNKYSSANYLYKNVFPVFENIGDLKSVVPYNFTNDYPKYLSGGYTNVLDDKTVNPNITVLDTELRDYASQLNPALNYEYYAIIKYTIDRPSFYKKFEAVDNVEFFQPLGGGQAYKYTQSWNFSSDEIPQYDSSTTDDEIKNLFIAPNGFSALGTKYSDIKLRINENSIDVFWCFIKMITNGGANPEVLRCFNEHSLQLKEKVMKSEDVKILNVADIDIAGNELIQVNTQYENQNIYFINQQNIVFDYKDGIATMSITISCGDYYYTNKQIAKDWSKGEMVDIGDVIQFEGVDKLWRVTGRNFRKVGVPMIDLELQEVRVVG